MRRRKWVSLMLAGTMAASLAGCSGSSDAAKDQEPAKTEKSAEAGSEKKEEAADSGEKTVVTVWTQDRHDSEYVESKIEEFNNTNDKGIEIALNVITDDYANMMSLAYSSGTAPDIAGVGAATSGFDLKTFAEAGILEPLNEYIKDTEYEKVTEASKLQFEGINVIDGNVYWIPTGMRSGTRIEYNKELVEKAGYTEFPDTLEGVVELADKITQQGEGTTYGVGFTQSVPFERWLEGVAETSGIYRYDFKEGKFNFGGYKPLIETASKFFTNNSVFPGSMSQGVDAMRAQFVEGTFGIWGNASQEAGVFTSQFPIDKFEWGVAEVPSLDGTRKGAQAIKPQKGYMMFSSCPHKDKAWEVIKFFSSEEFLKGYLEAGLYLPISDYMDGIIDKSKTGRLADFALTDYESVYPAVPSVTLEGDPYGTVIWRAIMGDISADEAIADLNKRYNEALENDIKIGKTKRIVIKDFDPLHPGEGTVEYTE
ncbi:extracellular solute-binding protein [Clostridium sp. AT4]|uniref:ABC transporter substrate-binding protein n=1 Tax=Clostridium sp. AT4 TaxID=1720194 RepID=UPI00082C3B75|nr:extracellular solute-binding protein [Clostridium sp. AT4]